MIRVAAGEKLDAQAERREAQRLGGREPRLCRGPVPQFPALDRPADALPPAGRDAALDGVTVRNDTGVYEGGEISIYYDPMIAKLVTHAPTREAAIDAQADALDAFVIDGIRHNIPFLAALMQHPRWRAGKLSTGFIAEEFPDGFQPHRAARARRAQLLAAVAAAIDHVLGERKRQISGQMTGRDGDARAPPRASGSATDESRSLDVGARGRRAIAVARRRSATATSEPARVADVGLEAGRSGLDRHDRRRAGRGAGAADRRTASCSPIAASRRKAYVYTEREAALARLMPVKKRGRHRQAAAVPDAGPGRARSR